MSIFAIKRASDNHGICPIVRGLEMINGDPCEYCDGKLQYRRIRAQFHFKGGTIYIDHVPAWVCAKCGERYFDAPVYKKLEDIAQHSDRIKKTITFPLADYERAAL
ncbi:MAG: hypothetical protein DDT18_00004 [Actinobacteria bacterium]|nr:hypothetical protein [Actinomycetota bacterium]